MKKHVVLFSMALSLAVVLFAGCKKEGIGGDSEIAFHVAHHDSIIPLAKVYIAYGATELPGTDPALYDDSTTTDGTGHGHFHELVKGDYYLYAIGYDSSISMAVTGGIPVKLKKSEAKEVDIPVTE
jgi:hypothetical protein